MPVDTAPLAHCLHAMPLNIVMASTGYIKSRGFYHGMIVFTKTESKGAWVVFFITSSRQLGVPVRCHELAQKTTHWICFL